MWEMPEMWVWPLCQEDPQEMEEATNTLQYSCLEHPMDREAWQATVYGVTKSWTQLSTHTHTHTHTHTCACAHMCTRTHTHTHTPAFPGIMFSLPQCACMFLIYWKIESDLRMWLIAECGLQLGSPGSWCCPSKSALSWTCNDLGVMRSFLLAVMKT